jgi:hypothetical protein
MRNKIHDAIKRHERKYHVDTAKEISKALNVTKWQPKVGDEVWWDGSDGAKQWVDAQIVKIVKINKAETPDQDYQLNVSGKTFWTTLEHLSPLPKPAGFDYKEYAREEPEHWDGEPFTGENSRPVSLPSGMKLVYTGKSERVDNKYTPKWFVYRDNTAWYGYESDCNCVRPILRAIPIESSPDAIRLAELEKWIEVYRKECAEILERMRKNG